MKQLFTPWRMKFIKEGKKQSSCILCDLQKQEDSVENLILYRGESCYIVMNKYPYNTGHIMVVPYAHGPDLDHLKHEVMQEVLVLAQKMVRILKKTHAPDGFNLGLNVGHAGGAGIPDHLHFHVVPRWTGDTNFMPLLSGTRVLPETVEESYHRIRKVLDQ